MVTKARVTDVHDPTPNGGVVCLQRQRRADRHDPAVRTERHRQRFGLDLPRHGRPGAAPPHRTAQRNWSWTEDYIYRGSQLLAAEEPYGTKHFHLDHLGTPRLITDGAGVQLSLHTYYAFGAEADTPTAGEKQFTGHERDSGTLDYMHARYYSPQMGRFLSVDPGGWNPSRPQSWNRYAYAINNPIRYIDPDGRDFYDIIEGVANGWSSSNLANLNRVEPRNLDYQRGQTVGDALAFATGTIESVIGVNALLGGGSTTVLSGGTLAPVTGTVAAGGLVAAIHGSLTTVNALQNLTHQASSTKGLENQVKKHEQKLADYTKNPDAHDNNGFLKNATPERRQKIIQARIYELKRQIEVYKKQIRDILKEATEK